MRQRDPLFKRPGVLILAALAVSLFGCSPNSSGVDRNLQCAALISAASHLASKGQIQLGAGSQNQMLISMMTHLNQYAVPKGLPEQDAFAELNTLREDLMNTMKPEAIHAKARACVRLTPRV